MGFWKWIRSVFRRVFLGDGADGRSLEGIVAEGSTQGSPENSTQGTDVSGRVNGFDYSTPWDSATYPTLLEALLDPIRKNPELGLSEEERREIYPLFENSEEIYSEIVTHYPYSSEKEGLQKANYGEMFMIERREGNKGVNIHQKGGESTVITYLISTEPIEEKLAPGLRSFTPLRKASEEEKAYQRKLGKEAASYLELRPVPEEKKASAQKQEPEVATVPVTQEIPAQEVPIQETPVERETMEEKVREEVPQMQEQEIEPALRTPQVPRAPIYTPLVNSAKSAYGKTKEFAKRNGKVLKTAGIVAALGLATWGAYYLNQNIGYGGEQDRQSKEKEKIVAVSGSKTGKGNSQSQAGVGVQNANAPQDTSARQTPIEQIFGGQPRETQPKVTIQSKSLEDKVKEGKAKVHEHKVKRGDSLWGVSESYGVGKIPSFINSVVDYNISHSKDSAFRQRIDRDTIYVKSGKVRYGESVDGIRGDNLRAGDVIMIPQELVEKYKTGKGGAGAGSDAYTLHRKAKSGKVGYHKSERAHEDSGKYQSTHMHGDQLVGLAITGDNRPILTFTRKIIGQKEKENEKILGTELHQVPYVAGKTKFGEYGKSLYNAGRRKYSK